MNQQEAKALWQTIRGVFEVLAVNAIIVALLLTLGWTVNVQNVAYPVASVFGLTQLTYLLRAREHKTRAVTVPRSASGYMESRRLLIPLEGDEISIY